MKGFFAKYPKAAQLAAYLFLDHGLCASWVHYEISHNAEQLGVPLANIPSRETVRMFLRKVPTPELLRLRRLGHTAFDCWSSIGGTQ